jgi:RNA-directed DNA polymerase
MPLVMPQVKKRTELLRKLKGVFNRSRSQPLHGVIDQINPILRGWENYFAVVDSSRYCVLVK